MMAARQFRDLTGRDVVIASHNQGKIAEFAQLLAPLTLRLHSAAAMNLPEPEETGTSFAANAELKARAAAEAAIKLWLSTDFNRATRHERRNQKVDQLTALENKF